MVEYSLLRVELLQIHNLIEVRDWLLDIHKGIPMQEYNSSEYRSLEDGDSTLKIEERIKNKQLKIGAKIQKVNDNINKLIDEFMEEL